MYYNIVFFQNLEQDTELEKLLRENDCEGMLEYCKQWDMDRYETTTLNPWGTSDNVWLSGDYALIYNRRIGYVGLHRKVNG